MTQNQKTFLKLGLWAIIIHVILIALTILEVFIYSTFINSGQDKSVYEQHAQNTAPYIAIIGGFGLIYLIAIQLKGKIKSSERLICLGLPIGYILLDVLLLIVSRTDLRNNFTIFLISYLTKLLAGYLAMKRV